MAAATRRAGAAAHFDDDDDDMSEDDHDLVVGDLAPAEPGATAGDAAGQDADGAHVVKGVRKRQKAAPLLTAERLRDEQVGLPALAKAMEGFEARGPGQELADLNRMLRGIERWGRGVSPHATFAELVRFMDRPTGDLKKKDIQDVMMDLRDKEARKRFADPPSRSRKDSSVAGDEDVDDRHAPFAARRPSDDMDDRSVASDEDDDLAAAAAAAERAHDPPAAASARSSQHSPNPARENSSPPPSPTTADSAAQPDSGVAGAEAARPKPSRRRVIDSDDDSDDEENDDDDDN